MCCGSPLSTDNSFSNHQQKSCEGSSISRVYTNSEDILETLSLDLNQEDERKEIEYSFDESVNALFTNSKSFGADVKLATGVSESDGNSHCIDKSEAESVEVGNTLENNGQTVRARESETTNRHKVNGGISFGRKRKRAVAAAAAAAAGTAGSASSLGIPS